MNESAKPGTRISLLFLPVSNPYGNCEMGNRKGSVDVQKAMPSSFLFWPEALRTEPESRCAKQKTCLVLLIIQVVKIIFKSPVHVQSSQGT
jgi:hypothetical protein